MVFMGRFATAMALDNKINGVQQMMLTASKGNAKLTYLVTINISDQIRYIGGDHKLFESALLSYANACRN